MIDVVKIIRLTSHKDKRCFFREIFQISEQFFDFSVGQLSHSNLKEGIVKAWHCHVNQSKWNYVLSGQADVVLFDNRENSLTYKETIEFVTNDKVEPIGYFLPPGVSMGISV